MSASTLSPSVDAPRVPLQRDARGALHARPLPMWKSAVDRVLAGTLLLLLMPVLTLIALAVLADGSRGVLYRQERIGLQGRRFTILKFRTMQTDAHERRQALLARHDGNDVLFKMRQDPRVTRAGRVLRRFSLDELPQLWNVLRGEMSLVGPRPALPDEVARYSPEVRARLLVKPGLTGLWQVSGRSDLSWQESVQLDLTYVMQLSPALDARILLRTAGAVLTGRGAY